MNLLELNEEAGQGRAQKFRNERALAFALLYAAIVVSVMLLPPIAYQEVHPNPLWFHNALAFSYAALAAILMFRKVDMRFPWLVLFVPVEILFMLLSAVALKFSFSMLAGHGWGLFGSLEGVPGQAVTLSVLETAAALETASFLIILFVISRIEPQEAKDG